MSYPGIMKHPHSERSRYYYSLVRSPMGCHGEPENDPRHTYSVDEHRGNGVTTGSMSLTYALDDDDVPETLKDRIRRLFAERDIKLPDTLEGTTT